MIFEALHGGSPGKHGINVISGQVVLQADCRFSCSSSPSKQSGIASCLKIIGINSDSLHIKRFKCPGYYCVPWRVLCDTKWDCPGGTDEAQCARTGCPGQFRCHNSNTCISPDSLCDNITDCILGDDEYFCFPRLPDCPKNCTCVLFSITCINWIHFMV